MPARGPLKLEGEPIGVTRLRPRPEFDRLFDALADAERLRLLDRLERSSSTAGKLAPELGWTRDEVAKQLKLLERAGLVEGARIGRRVSYARSSSALIAALDWSSGLWRRLPPAELRDAEPLDPSRQIALVGALRAAGRRGMLECMCRGGPITQGAAAKDCGLSQGLASRGLAQLVEVGLVEVCTEGPPRRYAAAPATLSALVGWLLGVIEVSQRAEAHERRYMEARAAERSR